LWVGGGFVVGWWFCGSGWLAGWWFCVIPF